MAEVKEVKVTLNIDSLRKAFNNACTGNVEHVVTGFPGQIHINRATGPAPKEGQKVIIIPVDDGSPMETPTIPL